MKLGLNNSEKWRPFYRRFLLLGMDSVIITLTYIVAWFGFCRIVPLPTAFWLPQWLVILGCMDLFLMLFRCNDSLWRYAESREYLSQSVAAALAFLLYFALDRLLFVPLKCHYSCRMVLFTMLVSLVGMWCLRFAFRYYRQVHSRRQSGNSPSAPLVIVGAGDAGVDLAEEIKRNQKLGYYIYGFFDDDPVKVGSVIRGVPVLGRIDQIVEKLKDTGVKNIVVAIPSISETGQHRILQICAQTNCLVRMIPRASEWLKQPAGSGLYTRVRNVSPEDLLGRSVVTFDNQAVYDFVRDKVIMVTGGGGSIGSELCRQVAAHHPRRLVIVDIYENNAYSIQQELLYEHKNEFDLCVEIASVRDRAKVDYLFRKYCPQIVFHAAAHKHVPLMEGVPEEAIKNNVFGTYNVAEAASTYGAEKFILISTDKAVHPTNVMGASKRMCEMVIQSMQDVSETKYMAVRFGNVLGSNGSVIPLFKKQLEHGGPITVTDRRIIRYFMTIPEAAQLVMQAGAMADSSEIFVLDMGEPVRILSLAENLVRLSGFTPYVDIDIVEIGLRPGEKLYEELLVESDTLTETKYNKIFAEQRESIPHETMQVYLQRLREVLDTEDPEQIIMLMRQIVPDFRTPEEVNARAEEKQRQLCHTAAE